LIGTVIEQLRYHQPEAVMTSLASLIIAAAIACFPITAHMPAQDSAAFNRETPGGSVSIADFLQRTRPRIVIIVSKSPQALTVHRLERGLPQIAEYPVCRMGMGDGPKCRQGDGVTPEGVYRIVVLNPNSAYHLSLGLDYPNAADRGRAIAGTDLGGDIYIHGNCVSVGCIAIGDAAIEVLYALVKHEVRQGRSVPVLIVPRRDPLEFERLISSSREEGSGMRASLPAWTAEFWEDLLTRYRRLLDEGVLN
jgi:murein L,D-transpeptidase YafK